MWYGLAYVPQEYMAYLLPAMTTLLPALLSMSAYMYEQGYEKAKHRKWLSYWTCWQVHSYRLFLQHSTIPPFNLCSCERGHCGSNSIRGPPCPSLCGGL